MTLSASRKCFHQQVRCAISITISFHVGHSIIMIFTTLSECRFLPLYPDYDIDKEVFMMKEAPRYAPLLNLSAS